MNSAGMNSEKRRPERRISSAGMRTGPKRRRASGRSHSGHGAPPAKHKNRHQSNVSGNPPLPPALDVTLADEPAVMFDVIFAGLRVTQMRFLPALARPLAAVLLISCGRSPAAPINAKGLEFSAM